MYEPGHKQLVETSRTMIDSFRDQIITHVGENVYHRMKESLIPREEYDHNCGGLVRYLLGYHHQTGWLFTDDFISEVLKMNSAELVAIANNNGDIFGDRKKSNVCIYMEDHGESLPGHVAIYLELDGQPWKFGCSPDKSPVFERIPEGL
jgi:hypothetical protein